MGSRARGAIVAAVLGFAALTALVFLVRAGDPGISNWPVEWELKNSDNGVLFQVMQDVVAGRSLDWSFSPQVYVFPELPISAAAFLLAGGSVYWYYLLVAVLSNTLLFVALLATARVIYPEASVGAWVARATLAASPLLIFPLIGTAWILSFPLAPTYYFGAYLGLLASPVLVLAHRRWVRIAVAVGLALTAASDPLVLVFAVPSACIALVVFGLRRGWRSAFVAAAPAGAALVLGGAVRVLLFGRLQGTSPLTYIDINAFRDRLNYLWPHYAAVMADESSGVILGGGIVLAVGCLLGAVAIGIAYLRRHPKVTDRQLAFLYLGLVPTVGIAGTAVLLITNHLYFWPTLIMPWVIVLLAVPAAWATRALPVVAIIAVAAGLVTGAPRNLANTERYFAATTSETQCLDSRLPAGVTVGYSTFSDGRRLSLTSTRPFRLIHLLADGLPSFWLTNRSYVSAQAGQFFYINAHGDERPIDADVIISHFGQPDSQFSCGDGVSVLVYTDPVKDAAIAEFYEAPPPRAALTRGP